MLNFTFTLLFLHGFVCTSLAKPERNCVFLLRVFPLFVGFSTEASDMQVCLLLYWVFVALVVSPCLFLMCVFVHTEFLVHYRISVCVLLLPYETHSSFLYVANELVLISETHLISGD